MVICCIFIIWRLRSDQLLIAYSELEYLLACSYARIQGTRLNSDQILFHFCAALLLAAFSKIIELFKADFPGTHTHTCKKTHLWNVFFLDPIIVPYLGKVPGSGVCFCLSVLLNTSFLSLISRLVLRYPAFYKLEKAHSASLADICL